MSTETEHTTESDKSDDEHSHLRKSKKFMIPGYSQEILDQIIQIGN